MKIPHLLLANLFVASAAFASTNEVIQVTASPLPKYRVESNTSGTLVDLPPEKAPFTVDTFTADFIRERNATDLDQLISYLPGVYQGGKTVMARQAGTYTIRGFSGSEVTLAGVPLTGGIGTFMDASLLDRVDVVKGPVGGAYGAQTNTMADAMGAGGSVVLSPKQAQLGESFRHLTWRGSYTPSGGSHHGLRMKVFSDINQVFVEDAFAVRVPFAYEWRDPDYSSNAARAGSNYSVAPSFAWQVEDHLKLGVDTFYQYSNQPAYQGIRTSYGSPIAGTDWDTTYTRPTDRMIFETAGGTVHLEGDITEWFSLRTRASFMQSENRWNYRGPASGATFNPANPNTLYEPSEGDRLSRVYFLSQEGLFKFDTADVEHQLLFGVDFLAKHVKGWSYFTSGSMPATRSYADTWNSKMGFTAQEMASWAGLTLIAGLRADWHNSVKHEHKWTVLPRLGLSYDIAEAGWVTVFGNISQTNTPNFNQQREPNGSYLSGTWHALQYEAGVKVNPIESLWVNASVYRIEQTNAPVNIGSTVSPYYSEEGQTRSQGVELSISGNITEAWSAYLAYTYINYYDNTNHMGFDRFPPHAVSLWTSYKAAWCLDTVFGAGLRWRDDWEMTFRGTRAGEQYAVKNFVTMDLSAETPIGEHCSVMVAVRNLFDKRGVESARNLQAFANDARTIELSVHFKF